MAVETVAGAEAVAAERARILSTLLGRIDAVTEAGVAAIRNQIPAYSAQRDERFLADLASQVRLNYSTTLSGMLEERVVTPTTSRSSAGPRCVGPRSASRSRTTSPPIASGSWSCGTRWSRAPRTQTQAVKPR